MLCIQELCNCEILLIISFGWYLEMKEHLLIDIKALLVEGSNINLSELSAIKIKKL